ncbi:MAG: VTT domain-containing protein [Bacteroidia bacterium]
MDWLEFLKRLTDPASIIQYGGLALLLFVVFAETGLMVGFFLPGDSLMFVSGLLCRTKPELLNTNIVVLLLSLIAAAVVGNMAGYWFGRRVGPALFRRNDSWIFKKRYLDVTQDFYTRHGGRALVLGRFIPIVRTFAPILAGVIKIDFKKFMLYNVLGAVAWVGSLGLAGYFLGQIAWVEKNIGYIVLFLIVITLIPVIRTWRSERARNRQHPQV